MIELLKIKGKQPFFFSFLVTVIFILLLEGLGMFDGLNRHAYDLFFRLRGSRDPGRRIVIVSIDEKSLANLGRWPLSRKYYAELLTRLQLADCVALDILMPEPAAHDSELDDAIQRHGKVLLPVHIDPQGQPVFPTDALNAYAYGHVHIGLGIDGVAREVYHTIRCNGVALPSLAKAVYDSLLSRPAENIREKIQACSAIEQASPMMINFYGQGRTFQHISFSEILRGRWEPRFFSGKIVLVGVTANGIEEGQLSPFSTNRDKMHGIETHAHILNNLLDGSAIRPIPEWLLLSLPVMATAVFYFLFWRSSPLLLLFWWSGGVIGIGGADYALFSGLNTWIPPGSLLASVTGAFVISLVLSLRQLYGSVIQAGREWKESFDTIDDAILIQDRSGHIILKNRAAEEMTGPFLMDALNKRFETLSPKSAAETSAEPAFGLSGATGGETEEITDSGSGRSYEIKILPRKDNIGRLCGAIQVVREITQKKKAREEQQALQKMLIQSQKMEAIGTLASGIAHDFNNILGAIVGYTELACYSLSPGENAIREKLDHVLKASERARNLIMQILTFSRRAEPETKTILVRHTLKEGMKLFRTTLPKSIKVSEHLSSDAMVNIDPTQLYQILMNLCTNAYHSMKEKGGKLDVSLENVDLETPMTAHGQQLSPGKYVILTVSDSGYGVSPENGEKIFEPYYTTKVKGEGTGLGLAIVKGITQDHGGLITFDSRPGEGTAFSVYLPRADRVSPPPRELFLEEAPAKGSANILLVDDNPQMLLLIKQILERYEYQVETRMNPLEACEAFKARSKDFDLVITDLDMPDMTGMALAEKLLEIRPETPIVLCTGYCEPGDYEKALAIGIKALVEKPFHASALARLIADLLSADPPQPETSPFHA